MDEVIHLVNIRDKHGYCRIRELLQHLHSDMRLGRTKMAKELSGSIRLCNSSGLIRHID